MLLQPPDVVRQLEVYAFLPQVLAHVDGLRHQAVVVFGRDVHWLLLGQATATTPASTAATVRCLAAKQRGAAGKSVCVRFYLIDKPVYFFKLL